MAIIEVVLRRLMVASFLASVGSGDALAHTPRVDRHVLLESSGRDQLLIAFKIDLSQDKSRHALFISADSNKDGRLSEKEEEILATHLLSRATYGVGLFANTRRLKLSSIKKKLAGFALMAYGVVTIPEDATQLRITTEPTGDLLIVDLLDSDGRKFTPPERAKRSAGSFVFEMRLGDEVRFGLGPASALQEPSQSGGHDADVVEPSDNRDQRLRNQVDGNDDVQESQQKADPRGPATSGPDADG